VNRVRAWCALLTCAVLCTSSAAYAQARAGASAQPNAATNSGADEPSDKEIAASNPCPRWGTEARNNLRQFTYDDRVSWVFAASTQVCVESVRSDAVAAAWARGLDEYGGTLDADARDSKLAVMEDWLRSLVGKHRIEGRRWNMGAPSEVLGIADCFGVGSGPGAYCVISAHWKPDGKRGEGKNPAQNVAIRPQILLFGLDPGAMEIRATHVDSIAVELHGVLQGGAVILSEVVPPEVIYVPDCSSVQSVRELVSDFEKGSTSLPPCNRIPLPLSRYPRDDDGHSARRLSRVAMTPSGEFTMQFYVFRPISIWGGDGLRIEGWNRPIEFDLQLHRESLVDAEVQGSAAAAEFTCAKQTESGGKRAADEREEGSASGKQESTTQEMQAWLARLVGQYSVEGTVDLCGEGNPAEQRPVTGRVDCIAAGAPPSSHCIVNVHWQPAYGRNGTPLLGGVSNLAPAQFLFSFFTREQASYAGPSGKPLREGPKRGLQLLQLDNQGNAEGAWSKLEGDTFMSREECIDIPGDCHKTARITAKAGSSEISMRMDVERNGKRVLRQTFLLRREQE
jgi:hypothetical protein